MRTRIDLIAATTVLLLAVLTGAAPAAADTAPHAPDGRSGPDAEAVTELAAVAHRDGTVRVLVGLDVPVEPDGSLSAARAATQRSAIADRRDALLEELGGAGGRVLRTYDTVPTVALELPAAAVEAMAGSPHVASVAPDEPLRPLLDDSVGLVEADLLWQLGLEGAGRSVAILDTGVDTAHPFVGDRIVAEACFSTDSSTTVGLCPNGMDTQVGAGAGVHCEVDSACGHGTHVAGIAAGAGPTMSGVAPGAGIVAVQVFQDSADGLRASTSDLLAALEWVYQHRDEHDLAAVNLSLGGGSYDRACDDHALAPVIDNLRSAGVATVVATGNAGDHDAISAPACVSGAVAVGASTKGGDVASFGNAHPDLLDLLAPGTSITSSVPGDDFAAHSGTSMSAPHVAGAWALLQEPDAPLRAVDDVLQALVDTGQPLTDTRHPEDPTYPEMRLEAAREQLTMSSTDPEPGGVAGTITDARDGVALEGASVALDDGSATLSGADGGYLLEGLNAGSYTVSATLDGYGSASADVDVLEGETITVDLALEPLSSGSDDAETDGSGTGETDPGAVAGTVTDADDGVALEGASVALDGEAVTTTGADGGFVVEGLAAGAYTVSATLDGYVSTSADVDVSAGQTVTADLRLTPEGPEEIFSDVSLDHAFFEEISWMAESGVTSGYEDGTFRPAAGVTRQAMAVFLFRVAGQPAGPFPDPGFSDVSSDHAFFEEISWMAQSGVTSGYEDGTFRPDAEVTRQAMAAFLYKSTR